MERPDNIIIEQFLYSLWLERNLAENTLAFYRLYLQELSACLRSQQQDCLSADFADLQSFLADRLDHGYKATSSARLLRAMGLFFQHIYREKMRGEDLSEAPVGNLLAAPSIDEPAELRDKAMLEVLYATGLLVLELLGLTLSDVSLSQGVVRVIGKGDKERLVPLGEKTVCLDRVLSGTWPSRADQWSESGHSVSQQPQPQNNPPNILASHQTLCHPGVH